MHNHIIRGGAQIQVVRPRAPAAAVEECESSSVVAQRGCVNRHILFTHVIKQYDLHEFENDLELQNSPILSINPHIISISVSFVVLCCC